MHCHQPKRGRVLICMHRLHPNLRFLSTPNTITIRHSTQTFHIPTIILETAHNPKHMCIHCMSLDVTSLTKDPYDSNIAHYLAWKSLEHDQRATMQHQQHLLRCECVIFQHGVTAISPGAF